MTPAAYNQARAALGLSNAQVAAWLGVSTRACEKWATRGPSGPAAVAIRMALKHGLDKPNPIPAKREEA